MQTGSKFEDAPTRILLIGDDADLNCVRCSIAHLWASIEIEHQRTVGKTIDVYGLKVRHRPATEPDCVVLGSDDPCAMRCKALRRVRTQTSLVRNPLIVLTNEENIRDIDTYLNAGASYAARRDQLRAEAAEIADMVTEYWLKAPIAGTA